LPDQVPAELRAERLDALLSLQARIHREQAAALVGTTQAVLVEGVVEGPLLVGRTRHQAPEVDGQVILDSGDVDAGEIVEVRITGHGDVDLIGEVGEGYSGR
jgi:ribosomal protein S12 methylthiotransferase